MEQKDERDPWDGVSATELTSYWLPKAAPTPSNEDFEGVATAPGTFGAQGVKWEVQFDRTRREVLLELAHAPRMHKFSHGFHGPEFQPQWVEVVFDNDKRRWVEVRGASILKNGDCGLRSIHSYYSGTQDDNQMPEWLRALIVDVERSDTKEEKQ